jgi:DNA-binding NtrC family response regulator
MRPLRSVVAVDNEIALLDALGGQLRAAELRFEAFQRASDALRHLEDSEAPDVVVVSLSLPNHEGQKLVRHVHQALVGIHVITLVDFETVEDGVESLRQGAFAYLLKPFSPAEFLATLQKIAEQRGFEESVAGLDEDPARGGGHFCGLVGSHPAMRSLYKNIRNLCEMQRDSTVLVQGESGTGKELVARAIHQLGPKSGEPFIAVNCGAIHPNLLEDQLFGHVRGAFTGASEDRDGCFVAAGQGSIFLDEVTEMAPELQVKLLRALQEREVSPLGSDRTRPWKARLIVATNRDLDQAVQSGSFRRDLFYRLKVIQLEVPPLRDRLEDVPALVDHFLNRLYQESKRRKRLSREALELLCRYRYPGNVRELRNALEHAFALGALETILPEDLPAEIRLHHEKRSGGIKPLSALERDAVVVALRQAGGKKVQAARILGIDRNRLYRLIQKHNIGLNEAQLESPIEGSGGICSVDPSGLEV